MHIFTCKCGESFEISPRQAGQSVTCPACSDDIRLPKLGEIKALPQADAKPREKAARSWSPAMGFLFSAMVLGFIVSAVFTGYELYQYAQIPQQKTEQEMIDLGNQAISNRNAPLLLEFWRDYGAPGMGIRKIPPYKILQDRKDSFGNRAMAGGVAAAIFLLGAVTVMTLGKSKKE